MKYPILYILLIYSTFSLAQQVAAHKSMNTDSTTNSEEIIGEPFNPKPDTNEIYYSLNVQPKFKNGYADWEAYVARHIKIPKQVRKNGKRVDIAIQFVVERNGDISNISIFSSPGNDFSREAIRLLKKSGKWQPGIRKGFIVRSFHTAIVHFDPNYNIATADTISKQDMGFPDNEISPEFMNGPDAWRKYINENIRIPQELKAKELLVQIQVNFVVEKNGRLSHIKVDGEFIEEKDGKYRNINTSSHLNDSCVMEAVRLIETSPKWRPGLINGYPARYYHYVTIVFRAFKPVPYDHAQRVISDSAYKNFQHRDYHHAILLYRQLLAIRNDIGEMYFLANCYDRMDSVDQEKNILEKAVNIYMHNKWEYSLSASCCKMLADIYLKKKDYQKALSFYNLYGDRSKNFHMEGENILGFNLEKENARSECFEGLKMTDSAVNTLTPYIFCSYKDVQGVVGFRNRDSVNMADSLKHNYECLRYLTLLEKLHSKSDIKAELKKADSGFYYTENFKEMPDSTIEKDVTCGFMFYGTPIIYMEYGIVDTLKRLLVETQTPFYTRQYHLQRFRQLPLYKMIMALPDED